jgi:hypothetical protein
MKKVVLLVALLATACGQGQLTPGQVAAAMPQAAVIAIDQPDPGLPAASGSSGTMLSVQAAATATGPASPAMATPAGRSPLGVTSYLFARAVNGGVFWTLAPIAYLTEVVPPTSCTATACTWGPGSQAAELNDWMLVVTKAGEAYDYTLSGRPKAPAGSPFVAVITGRAYPGAERHHGHGTLAVDFDAAWSGLAHAAADVKNDFGTLAVDYDARQGLTVDVTFLGARNNEDPGADASNPNRVNAIYAYHRDASGGDLQIGWRTLPPSAAQTVSLHTRWQPGGAGRADFQVTVPAAQAAVSQCWDGAPRFLMTYDGLATTGLTDPGACVFATAAPITITVP